MQIHEITKGPKRTDEGILDDLKAAVTATKTGYKQGGLKGVAKNLTSRTAYQQALQQNQRADTNKSIDKLEKKWGTQIKRPLSYYVDQLKTPTKPEFKPEADKAADQRKQLEPEFADTFINDEPDAATNQVTAPGQASPVNGAGDVLPDPGQALTVTLNKGNYYKTPNGKWYNENGQQLPQSSYAGLEDLINQDNYKQVPIPTSVPGGQVAPVGKTKKTQATPKTNMTAPAANNGAQSKQLEEGGNASRKARREAQRAAAKTPATAPVAPAEKKGRANLKSDFGTWIASQLGGDYKEIINTSPQIKSELTQIFTKLTTEKDPAAVKALFDKYVLTAQAAMLKARVEGGVQDSEDESNIGDQLSQLRGQQGKKTGNQKLDQLLTQAGVALNESQVAVSKDIHVKSSLGDYVKRASDQQWYDPKGVLISQEKYPDFVKKLDATPAAQTAYQSALSSGGGSDSAYIKAQVDAQVKAQLDAQAKKAVAKAEEMHPSPPMPQATAADWEEYKAEQNRINNQMIDKTVNDLRNAEYFNTGQQEYLKQQMAQLMAKKF